MNDQAKPAPEGFRQVDLDWSTIPPVDWREQDEVMGVVRGGKWAQYERRNQMVTSGIIKLETEDGPKLLWESTQLTDLFLKLKLGDTLLVRYKGKINLPSGNQLNQFDAFVKPADERAHKPKALGTRPAITPAPSQTALPGMAPPAAGPAPVEEFDDDIPF